MQHHEISIIAIPVLFWSEIDNCIKFHGISVIFVSMYQNKVTEVIPAADLGKDENTKIFKWERIEC